MEYTVNSLDTINITPKYVNSLIEKHRLNHIAGATIDTFNKKYLEQLNVFREEGIKINEKYYFRVVELSEIAYNKLNIQNIEDLNKLKAAISMSERISNKAFKERDFESFVNALYNLKSRLKIFYK